MKFLNIKPVNFSDDALNNAIKLNGKSYSDFGLSISELSALIGVPESIIFTYDNWFKLDDGFYYYKNRGIFAELFLSRLASKCNVRCVDFKLAYNPKGELGIVSKLYRTRDKQYFSYKEFCQNYFGSVENDLGFFRLGSSVRFGEEKTDVLMDDIFGAIVFGIFSGQWDIGLGGDNFFFEYGEDGPRIAPFCDNGGSFLLGSDYESPFGTFSLCSGDDNYVDKSFLYLLSHDDSFYNKFQLVLNININEVLENTIAHYGILMEDSEKKKILDYFDNRKQMISHMLELGGRSK